MTRRQDELSMLWTQEIAAEIRERVRKQRGEQTQKIICASGISPSGPIHLGNTREILTTHFVVEELRSQGIPAEHWHYWDDYDRLRKVPPGVPEDWQEHLGKPLCDVPDPCCSHHASYAEHFMEEFTSCLAEIGVKPTFIRQSESYRRGIYNESCRIAMANRETIFDILADFQSEDVQTETRETRRAMYYPFRVYCQSCGKDFTEIRLYDPTEASIDYSCSCGHQGQISLRDGGDSHGKLAWKVDWPMRWNHAQVDFEPGGEDHSCPGSSFDVGKRIVQRVFHSSEPHYASYAFVGFGGAAKMSSSAGITATPRTALDIFEPALLRWLYLRRSPNKAFSIDFGSKATMIRIYEEWDRLNSSVDAGESDESDTRMVAHCLRNSSGAISTAEEAVSFRVLVAAADIAQGNEDVMFRIVADHLDSPVTREVLEPRFSCASCWVANYMPKEERTMIREEFSLGAWEETASEQRECITLLLDMLAEHWSLSGLTRLVYGVPKLQAGIDMDAAPTKDLKASQRAFFIAIYKLLCSSDTGPRLPTLFLALGIDKVRTLLWPPP